MEAFDGGRRPDWPVRGQGVVASKGAALWTEETPIYCFTASAALKMIYMQPNSDDSFDTRWMKRTCTAR